MSIQVVTLPCKVVALLFLMFVKVITLPVTFFDLTKLLLFLCSYRASLGGAETLQQERGVAPDRSNGGLF